MSLLAAVVAPARPLSFWRQHELHIAVYGVWMLGFVVVMLRPRRSAMSAWSETGATGVGEVRARLAIGPWTLRTESLLQLMALGLGVAAGVHLAVMPSHFRESWIYGAFFVVAVLTQVVSAVAVLRRPSRWVVRAVAASSAAIVVLWLYTRVGGVPVGPDHGATEEVGVLDVVASGAELAVALSGVLALWSADLRPAWRWRLWAYPMRLSVLSACVAVPVLAVLNSRG